MTTQSTGSLKGRIAGVLITLIALPIFVLAPAFLADRFTMQSPIPDNQASIQPSTSDAAMEPIREAATIDERPIQIDEGFVVSVEDVVDFESSITSSTRDFDVFSEEVVFLDAQSDDDCVLTLRFVDSTDGESETITGTIRFYGEEIGASIGGCGIYFADWEAQ